MPRGREESDLRNCHTIFKVLVLNDNSKKMMRLAKNRKYGPATVKNSKPIKTVLVEGQMWVLKRLQK